MEDRIAEYGAVARERLERFYHAAGVTYPGGYVTLLGIKNERRLEVYAGLTRETTAYVRSYPIHGASGVLGPKLREGDHQVPEGIYGIESLNPNSRFHLSLRVSYPNEFDRRMGARDGREDLGGDIMIHGGAASIGCLAIGDEAAEDLFVLAADVGIENVAVVLSPADFRADEIPVLPESVPPWTGELHATLRSAVERLSRPPRSGE